MMKMVLTSNQKALEYAAYMMIGSYFKKTKCISPVTEKKMRIQYVEQKLDNQLFLENICIKYAESKLMKELPRDIWKSEMKVRLVNCRDGKTEIQFINSKYVLVIVGEYNGKRTQLSHALLVR